EHTGARTGGDVSLHHHPGPAAGLGASRSDRRGGDCPTGDVVCHGSPVGRAGDCLSCPKAAAQLAALTGSCWHPSAGGTAPTQGPCSHQKAVARTSKKTKKQSLIDPSDPNLKGEHPLRTCGAPTPLQGVEPPQPTAQFYVGTLPAVLSSIPPPTAWTIGTTHSRGVNAHLKRLVRENRRQASV